MGELTELVLHGDLCQACGQEMGPGEGYPRTCEECHPPTGAVAELIIDVHGAPLPKDVEARIREELAERGQVVASETTVRIVAQLFRQNAENWEATGKELDDLFAEGRRLADQSFDPEG